MAEMVVALPLLLLLAAGIFQFTLLFLCRIQFDHACGETAREWAAGARTSSNINQGVWFHLSPYQAYFERDSIQASPPGRSLENGSLGQKRSDVLKNLGPFGPFLGRVRDGLFDYACGDWRLSIRMRSKPLFGVIFPKGILFTTRVSVLRHPGALR